MDIIFVWYAGDNISIFTTDQILDPSSLCVGYTSRWTISTCCVPRIRTQNITKKQVITNFAMKYKCYLETLLWQTVSDCLWSAQLREWYMYVVAPLKATTTSYVSIKSVKHCVTVWQEITTSEASTNLQERPLMHLERWSCIGLLDPPDRPHYRIQ